MTKLSVNINKLATLRNARGKNNPDILAMALQIISYGAQGITVHPRPDGRHIRQDDVFLIAKNIDVELNIEGYPNKEFMALVLDIKPAQCTFVPDPPHVLTSNAGWNIEKHVDFLQEMIAKCHDQGIRTSLFIDPYQCSARDLEWLLQTKTDRIELYTEAYAMAYGSDRAQQTLSCYQRIAAAVQALDIDVNAGHDLDLHNLAYFVQNIPSIQEVSIGHALVCDALQWGMEETISRYLACLV